MNDDSREVTVTTIDAIETIERATVDVQIRTAHEYPRNLEHFLERACAQEECGKKTLSRESISALERYRWPGNVRELENAIERAVALTAGDVLTVGDFPPVIVRAGEVEGIRDSVRTGKIPFEDAVGDFERTLILEALSRAEWNQTRAADQLQITRRSLKLKMDRHSITPP